VLIRNFPFYNNYAVQYYKGHGDKSSVFPYVDDRLK